MSDRALDMRGPDDVSASTGDVDPNGDVVDLGLALVRLARLRAAVGPDHADGFDPAEHVARVSDVVALAKTRPARWGL